MQPAHNRKFYYGWVVAVVTFGVLLVGAGVRSTPGVLMLPLQREFGWSAATISAAVALNIFLFGMMGPFAVAVMERFGLRRTVCAALVVLACAVSTTTLMRTPWQMMLLWGVLTGSGTGMIAMVLGATIAGRWFARRKGLVLGVLTASSATGQLVFLPILASLAVNHGWRFVSFSVAGAALLMAPIAGLLLRDRPSDLGLPRYGETNIQPQIRYAQNPARRALTALWMGFHSRDFWLLAGSFFICGATTNGLVGTHLIALCFDHGIPEVAAAGTLALMGFCDIIGSTASGWLTDRYDSKKLLTWYYSLRGLSLLFLPYAFDFSVYGLALFAIFYGLDWIATVPPTVRLIGRSFGEENAPLMYGWVAASHQIGAAMAAWTGGMVRTQLGDYFAAFFSAGLLCLLAAILVTFIGKGRKPVPIGQIAPAPAS